MAVCVTLAAGAQPTLLVTDWKTPVKLPSQINTAGWEDSVHISPQGNIIYFMYAAKDLLLYQTAGQTRLAGPARGMSYLDGVDMFMAKKVNGKWQNATIMPYPVTGAAYAECCGWVSNDNNRMYYSRGYPDGIYIAAKASSNTWSEPVMQGPFQPGDENISLTSDERLAFFDSFTRGGYGGKDLFMIARNADGSWGEVQNLGPVLNSQYHEGSPFSADGKSLYFDDHGSTGIFRSVQGSDGAWSPRQKVVSGNCADPSLTAAGELYMVCADILKDSSGKVIGFDANIWYAARR